MLLRRVERLAGWHVREHQCQCVRAKRARRDDSRGMAQPLAALASWSMHGIKSKRADVEYFLRKKGVAILALQETLKSDDYWRLRLADYHIVGFYTTIWTS